MSSCKLLCALFTLHIYIFVEIKKRRKIVMRHQFQIVCGLYSRKQTVELINCSVSGKIISGYYASGGFMCCLKKETFQACMFNAGN